MSLVINHNLIAINAAKSLARNYRRLGQSTQRLSTGLKINSAGDDPSGLAIRELMRTDITVMYQGKRNATDGISMLQTAEGAMAIIDEKLIRMKELAEQAATGTYTTVQREIMNSEYQAMAAEIDRIANATEFNGIKLLNGSISSFHIGSGLKIHFGGGNSQAEDYYFVNIGDVRATSASGLRVGGDGLTDIHRQNESAIGFATLDSYVVSASAQAGDFIYYYNYLGDPNITSAELQSPSFLAGIYDQQSGTTLQHLINDINQGTASRIQINFGPVGSSADGSIADLGLASGGVLSLCIGDEVFQLSSGGGPMPVYGKTVHWRDIAGSGASDAATLVGNFIANSSTTYHPVINSGDNTVMVFFQQPGDRNSAFGCDWISGGTTTIDNVSWTNVDTGFQSSARADFSLGGMMWGRAGYYQDEDNLRYYMTITGENVGDHFDVIVGSAGTLGAGYSALSVFSTSYFEEIQDASWGHWPAAQIRTQSHAQEALEAINRALEEKDIVRANLGAVMNRLENTVSNLAVQAENLQGSESRISDVDVALETTEYTRNNILAQAAASMLAQANTLPQLALTLLG